MSIVNRSDIDGTYKQFKNYKSDEEVEIEDIKAKISKLINTEGTDSDSWEKITTTFEKYNEKLNHRKSLITNMIDEYYSDAKNVLTNYLDSSPTGPVDSVSDDNLSELQTELNRLNNAIEYYESNFTNIISDASAYLMTISTRNMLSKLISYIEKLAMTDKNAVEKVTQTIDNPMKDSQSVHTDNLESEEKIIKESFGNFDNMLNNNVSSYSNIQESIDFTEAIDDKINDDTSSKNNTILDTEISNIDADNKSSSSFESENISNYLTDYENEISALKPEIEYPEDK